MSSFPIHSAIQNRNRNALSDALTYSNNSIDQKDDDGRTPLHLASIIGVDANIMIQLFEKNPLLDEKDNDGNTPLHLAATTGNIRMITALLMRDANVESENSNGNTPYQVASNREVQDLLASFGAANSMDIETPEPGPEHIIPDTLLQEDIIPLLDDATGRLNFLKTVIGNLTSKIKTFDLIMAEEVLVGDYLKQDTNHVVFIVDKLIYAVDKTSIDLRETFFECKEANGFLMQNSSNIVDTELINLRRIGGNGFVLLSDISRSRIIDSNVFILEKVKNIPTVVSKSVLKGGDVVSAMHCQPGFDDILYKISINIKL